MTFMPCHRNWRSGGRITLVSRLQLLLNPPSAVVAVLFFVLAFLVIQVAILGIRVVREGVGVVRCLLVCTRLRLTPSWLLTLVLLPSVWLLKWVTHEWTQFTSNTRPASSAATPPACTLRLGA